MTPPPAFLISGTAYFSYDPDGNIEGIKQPDGSVTYFEHGSHGLVTRIKPLGGTDVEFGYDALLRRVRMTEGATTTYFRHDASDYGSPICSLRRPRATFVRPTSLPISG